jgi:hypothetical protein
MPPSCSSSSSASLIMAFDAEVSVLVRGAMPP